MSYLSKYTPQQLGATNVGDAASAAQQAYLPYAHQAIDEYRRGQAGAQEFYNPYAQAGQGALQQYEQSMGMGGSNTPIVDMFKQSPGYKFAQQQGEQAIQRQMAARGLSGSGAEGKALTQYAQGLAGQQYGKYQDRLSGLAQFGGKMGAQGQQLGLQYGQLIGGGLTGIGSSAANSIMTQARLQAEEQMAREQAEAQEKGSEFKSISDIAGVGVGALAKHFNWL